MLQVSLWHTDLKEEHIRVRANRKHPDPDVISLSIGHEVTLYMSLGLAQRVMFALDEASKLGKGAEWVG
jgi:hypothetical protein